MAETALILEQAPSNGFHEDKQQTVLRALNNKEYVWRTVDGIAKETNLEPDEVVATLSSLPEDTLAVTHGKKGTLYTTRDHYFQTQSFLGRFLTAATGQFK